MGIHEYPSSRAKEKWRDKSDFYPKCMVKHFIKLSLSLPSIVAVGEVFPWPGTQNHILYITPQNHGMEVYRNASKCCYDPVRCCRSVQSFHVHSSEKMSRLPDSKFFILGSNMRLNRDLPLDLQAVRQKGVKTEFILHWVQNAIVWVITFPTTTPFSFPIFGHALFSSCLWYQWYPNTFHYVPIVYLQYVWSTPHSELRVDRVFIHLNTYH